MASRVPSRPAAYSANSASRFSCARMSIFRLAASAPHGDALFLEQVLQFARLVHFADDVAAADELALDVELRDGRPVREFLDALADLRIGQHVNAFELHADLRQNLHYRRREAALRKDGGALHE